MSSIQQQQLLFDTSNLNLFCNPNSQINLAKIHTKNPLLNIAIEKENEITEVKSNISSDSNDLEDCEEYIDEQKSTIKIIDDIQNELNITQSQTSQKQSLDISQNNIENLQQIYEKLDKGYESDKNINSVQSGISPQKQIFSSTPLPSTTQPEIFIPFEKTFYPQQPLQSAMQQNILSNQQQQQISPQFIQNQQFLQQSLQNLNISGGYNKQNVQLESSLTNQYSKNFNLRFNTVSPNIQNKNISFISNTDSTYDSDNLNSVRQNLNNNNNNSFDPNISFMTHNTSVNDMNNSSYNTTQHKSASKANGVYNCNSNRNSNISNPNNSYLNNSNNNSHNNSQNNSYMQNSRRNTIEYMDGQQLFIMQQSPNPFYNNQSPQYQQCLQNLQSLTQMIPNQQQNQSQQQFNFNQNQNALTPQKQQQSNNKNSQLSSNLNAQFPSLNGKNGAILQQQQIGSQNQSYQQNQQFLLLQQQMEDLQKFEETEEAFFGDDGYQILSQQKINQIKKNNSQKQQQNSTLNDKKSPSQKNLQQQLTTGKTSPNTTTNNAQTVKEYAGFDIDLDKVQQDGRTTLMIRNIPNKYTLNLLLQTIDKNHKKKYDFFYLPIDFRNKCNVGYAFLNFIDTQFIVPFYKEFSGRKWEKFFSEKICEIKYARIQGRNALVKHFQQANENKLKPLILPKADRNHIEQLLQKQRENCQQEK